MVGWMRIAINASFWEQEHTGSGQYLHRLVAKLRELSPHDEFLLLSPAWITSSLPLKVITPFDRLSDDLAKLWFEQVAFPRACQRLGADIAHVPYFAPLLRPTAPTLVTIHDLIPLLLPAYRGSALVRLYTWLAAQAAHRADLILTDSYASRRDIIRHLGVLSDRVRVVHLAADSAYRPIFQRAQLEDTRRKYDLPRSYLLYLGGFDQRKNVALLLRAFARIAADCQAWLVVAGKLPEEDTPFTPDPRRITRELDIVERVSFTGWVSEEDKPALYSGARAFLFPSQYEGFGLPPLEAMACGTPVIGGDRGSLPEVIGEGGIMVPPDDVSALAEAMSSLWEDEALRQDIGKKALCQARRFSWDRTARRTLEAYREVLADRP
ncbi:MAG: glycosyltransferase family 1 protein [Chloroflexota bacterium]|nr:glycosyltransferase family 1 protein [Chloroflexota bacterium]